MRLSEFLKKRLEERGWSKRKIETETKGEVSNGYVHDILNERVKKVSVEKLRLIAKAFGDDEEVWKEAAGYSRSDASVKDRLGPLFTDRRIEICKRDDVLQLLDFLDTISEKDRKLAINFLISYKDIPNS